MERYGLPNFLAALLWVLPLSLFAHSAHEPSLHASVCELTNFGAKNDEHIYETSALYVTDFRHGAWLIDPENQNCRVQLGIRQSDIDGSVARFMQALVNGVMRHGPGAKRALQAELVFHWVAADPQGTLASPGRSWVPKGMVELRRVLRSAPVIVTPNQSSKRTRVPRAA
jgi:hypothetical protein